MLRTSDLLLRRFGPEWRELSPEAKRLVGADFEDMLLAEYDTPDPTMDDGIADENALEAVRNYRRRIGGGNLTAYAQCLAAGKERNG